MTEELKQHVLKNGLTLGAILVAITLFTYLGGAEMATNYIVSISALLLMIVYPIYQTLVYRTALGGFITFREAFTSCTGILIAAGFVNVVFSILLYNVIDPQFAVELIDAVINKTVVQLESMGMDEETIESTIKTIEESSSFTPSKMFSGYIMAIIFYTVFGLLVAAFTKKDKPEFSEE